MKHYKFVYRRVSSYDQNLDRQLPDLPFESNGEYKVYADKKSGKDFNREGWKAMVERLEAGDEIYIHSLDRMGRNLLEILKEIEHLVKEVGVTLHFEKEGIHLVGGEKLNAMQNCMLQMLAVVAEMERNLINERRMEGIAAAKAAGKHCGRPPKGLSRAEVNEEAILAALAEGKSVRKVAEDFNVSKSMVHRIKKDHQ
ncbi:recombinase family protein [Escherichia coli]